MPKQTSVKMLLSTTSFYNNFALNNKTQICHTTGGHTNVYPKHSMLCHRLPYNACGIVHKTSVTVL